MRNGNVVNRIHNQRKSNDTVTAVDSLQGVGVTACGGQYFTEEIVAFALTHRVRNRRVIDGIHHEGQGDDAVTTIDGLQGVGIDPGGRQGGVEEVIAIALAHRVRHRRVIDRIHREGQSDDAVAAVNGLQGVGVGAGLCENIPIEVEAPTLADVLRNGNVVNLVYVQGQRNDAVAAVDGLQSVEVSAWFSKDLSIEVEATALADILRNGNVVNRIHSQGQ